MSFYQYPKGVPAHGEFSSADAHAPGNEAAARFSLFGAAQTAPALPTALTLGSGDYAIVGDVEITAGAAALIVQLFDGGAASPGAGNLIAKITVPANSTVVWAPRVPHVCQQGSYPKLLTNVAGQVDAVIRLTIYTHPGT